MLVGIVVESVERESGPDVRCVRAPSGTDPPRCFERAMAPGQLTVQSSAFNGRANWPQHGLARLLLTSAALDLK